MQDSNRARLESERDYLDLPKRTFWNKTPKNTGVGLGRIQPWNWYRKYLHPLYLGRVTWRRIRGVEINNNNNNNNIYLTAIGLSSGSSGFKHILQVLEIVLLKFTFTSGGLHENHVVASWKVGNHRVFLPAVLSRIVWSFWRLRHIYPRGNDQEMHWILWSLASVWTQCCQENNSASVTITTFPCLYWLREETFNFLNLLKAVLFFFFDYLSTNVLTPNMINRFFLQTSNSNPSSFVLIL
jgi:hypothetical protein